MTRFIGPRPRPHVSHVFVSAACFCPSANACQAVPQPDAGYGQNRARLKMEYCRETVCGAVTVPMQTMNPLMFPNKKRGFAGARKSHPVGYLTYSWRACEISGLALVALAAGAQTNLFNPNALTAAEKENGWKQLFDGRTTQGWRGFQRQDFPTNGWTIEAGCLKRFARSCDIVTVETYLDFELAWEWKIAKKGNSGVKYLVDESRLDKKNGKVSRNALGNEYQMLDDAAFPDLTVKNKTGSWYSVLEPQGAVTRPLGEFNQSRIVVRGAHVEHWLNGVKILEFELGTPSTAALIAKSNFKNVPGYAEKKPTPILLQDHGTDTWFRQIKIRRLDAKP
jgi:hypothetical protein